MKVLSVFLLAVCLAFSTRAQDAAPATVDLQPKPTPSAMPAVSPPPEPVAPELPELSRLDEAFNHTSIGEAGDEARQRVEIRSLQNRVVNEPDVIAAKKYAEAAPTDLEKRERLRAYYELSYGRMRRSASSEGTRKALDEAKGEHLRLLDQPRVRPVPGATVPPVDKKKAKADKKKKSKLGRVTGR